MATNEFERILQRGQEAINRSEAFLKELKQQARTQPESTNSLERRSEDIHKDYLKSSEQTRQHLDDLHARNMAMTDLRIARAKAVRQPEPAAAVPSAGSNIEKLRQECGWTIEDLADKTKLDEKTIRGHIKGNKMRPSTPKFYEDAFSGELGRKVTITPA
jgi:ribosome-binding protein aMBF1 (putative translation factor)